VQPGGPPIFTSASGESSLARAAKWADGWQGAIMDVDRQTLDTQVRAHLDAWERAGRSERPYLMNSLWFALGDDDAQQVLSDTANAYYGLPPGSVTSHGTLPVHSADGVKMAVDNCREAGFDELVFIPLSDDLRQLDLLETALTQI